MVGARDSSRPQLPGSFCVPTQPRLAPEDKPPPHSHPLYRQRTLRCVGPLQRAQLAREQRRRHEVPLARIHAFAKHGLAWRQQDEVGIGVTRSQAASAAALRPRPRDTGIKTIQSSHTWRSRAISNDGLRALIHIKPRSSGDGHHVSMLGFALKNSLRACSAF